MTPCIWCRWVSAILLATDTGPKYQLIRIIVINRSRGLFSRYLSTPPECGVAYMSTKAQGALITGFQPVYACASMCCYVSAGIIYYPWSAVMHFVNAAVFRRLRLWNRSTLHAMGRRQPVRKRGEWRSLMRIIWRRTTLCRDARWGFSARRVSRTGYRCLRPILLSHCCAVECECTYFCVTPGK